MSDNGRGFAVEDAVKHGLAGLRDRITALGGTVRIVSQLEDGTTLTATLPVP